MSLLYVSDRMCASSKLDMEDSPLLSDPLAILGIFMMGASVGALLMHIKYKSLPHDCRNALQANLSNIFPKWRGR